MSYYIQFTPPEIQLRVWRHVWTFSDPLAQAAFTPEYMEYDVYKDFTLYTGPDFPAVNKRYITHVLTNTSELVGFLTVQHHYNLPVSCTRTRDEQSAGLDLITSNWRTNYMTSFSVKMVNRHDKGCLLTIDQANRILANDKSDVMVFVDLMSDMYKKLSATNPVGAVLMVPTSQFKLLYQADKFKSLDGVNVLVDQTLFEDGSAHHYHLFPSDTNPGTIDYLPLKGH